MHSSSEERGGGTLRCVPSRWRSERREGMKKILGDERGETEKRTDGESGSRDGPRATPRGVLGKPVEKSDERSQHGSPRDWEYRLLRRLRRERKAGPGSRRQGADREVDGSWMRGRDGEEERRGGGVRERESRERKVSSEPAPV